MCASNLGVCCGPSLLWSPSPSVNQSRAIPNLTESLIRHCETLFGEGVLHLFGEERSDSGAEESTDSLHCESLDSIPTERGPGSNHRFSVYRCGAAGGLSLDSLDLNEPPRKDQLTLSRDSGLTLSDGQLFVPESPVGSETSSGANTSTTSKEDQPQPRPTPTRTKNCARSIALWQQQHQQHQQQQDSSNPNFQRQDWLRHQLKRTPRTNNNTLTSVSKIKLSEIYANPRPAGFSIFTGRDSSVDLYGDLYRFRQAEAIDDPSEDEHQRKPTFNGNSNTWLPETPPPLPPRLRHLPPVHVNYEDRHKVAASRSRSLPPQPQPPPYRLPPTPRSTTTTTTTSSNILRHHHHLGFARSLLDDESYV